MSSTRTLPQRKAGVAHGFKALDEAGTFEAVVAVFGNIDLGNDRIIAGAFADSLDRWKASGDPIPVIFSHRWDDLDAHVGEVLDAQELMPGDARLPAELADLGGLYVKARMEVGEDFAGRLWKRLRNRTIREFSFAYDVVKARPGEGGALDLLTLDLIEVGPTLKGMNPLTALIGAKNRNGNDALAALDVADGLAREITGELTIAAKTAADAAGPHLPDPPAKTLTVRELPGSVEATLAAIYAAADVWAGIEHGEAHYATHLEATYLNDGVAIVTAERWEDPLGEGPVFELAYTIDDAGIVTIEDATPAEVSVSVAAVRAERAGDAEAAAAKESAKPASASATVSTNIKAAGTEAEDDTNEDAGTVERTLAEAGALAIGIDL